MARTEHNPAQFVGVATPTLIFVGMPSREAFDMIDAPVGDIGIKPDGTHVLTKTVGNLVGGDKPTVVFQYWLKSLTTDGYRARLLEKERDDLLARTDRDADANMRLECIAAALAKIDATDTAVS